VPRVTVREFWKGLDTNRAATKPGYALVARNVLLTRAGRAEVRPGILRAHHTRSADETIWNLFEFRDAAGLTYRLVKTGTTLARLALAGGAPVANETGMSAAGPASMAEAQDLVFLADQRAKNYVTTGGGGVANTLPLDKAAPSAALSPVGAGTATGMVAGTYRVACSFYNPTFDWTTPPRAYEAVTITANQAIRVTTPADPGDGFTKMYFWRTKIGEVGPFYWIGEATTWSTTHDLTAIDSDIVAQPSTYYLSPVHNLDGEIVAANPPACKFANWHKHRLALGSDSTKLLRIYFSDLDKPTSFFVTTVAKEPSHYHDLLEGQGYVMTGLNDLNGAFVAFKDYSITIRNGDIDPASWQWYVAVDGTGCIAPWSRAVAPGLGIFFAGADGVFLLDDSFRARRISDAPDGAGIGDDYRALDFTKVEYWWGAWSEREREYLLGVTTSAAAGTAPDRVYSYAPDTGAWSTRDYGMALVLPTCAGLMTNEAGRPKVYCGTSAGYVYETGHTAQSDGPMGGTVTGVATAGAGTTLTDSAAAFYATGDGLTGLVLTVRHSATSYESRLIVSNTATVLTVASAWAQPPVPGERYFVGAIEGTLALAQWDGQESASKQWHAITGAWTKQAHTTPVRVGFTLDDDAVPTYHGSEETMGDVRFALPAGDRGVEMGAYFDIIGTGAPFEIKGVSYEFDLLGEAPAS